MSGHPVAMPQELWVRVAEWRHGVGDGPMSWLENFGNGQTAWAGITSSGAACVLADLERIVLT